MFSFLSLSRIHWNLWYRVRGIGPQQIPLSSLRGGYLMYVSIKSVIAWLNVNSVQVSSVKLLMKMS
jgi:hypothetical protein